MRTLLIGHRGTGKTSLLSRIETYYKKMGRKIECIDLDREVERRAGQSVSGLFATLGEAKFRELEKAAFDSIHESTAHHKHDVYLACGAGFDPSEVCESWKALWLRRSSDEHGRIFTDRPRLNANVSPLDEFIERYEVRQKRFMARADDTLWLDEGMDAHDLDERDFILDDVHDLNGAVTLMPETFRAPHTVEDWIRTRVNWGVRWIELRDDLLDPEQMSFAAQLIPDEKVLVSFRSKGRFEATRELVDTCSYAFDWPLERGACEVGEPRFLSLHERLPGQSLKEALARFPRVSAQGTQLKAALPVHDFNELMVGHEWMMSFGEARIFLPMSKDGRWAWYRLWNGGRTSLNFFRDGSGSGPDQPTLLQWLRRRRIEKSALNFLENPFAAILGDPVAHSRTPIEQREFFSRFGASVFAIRMTEDEMRNGALTVLCRLGLRWAAVTSPLKQCAFEKCVPDNRETEELHTVNTLMWSDDQHKWLGTNTDIEGLRTAIEEIRKQEPLGRVAVWGGGGTLNVVKAVLPDAQLFSLRTGENRDPNGPRADEYKPDTVIWAVGRSREKNVGGDLQPHANWQPRRVVDLNYADDSPGREYALQAGCRYISGLAMFRHQAEAQRRFWNVSGDN